MLKFLLGFVVAVVLVFTAGFCYVRFGFIDPRADLSVGWLESKIAMPALDAAVDRRAPEAVDISDSQSQNVQSGVVEITAPCKSAVVVRFSRCNHYFQRPRMFQTTRVCAHDNQCAKLH